MNTTYERIDSQIVFAKVLFTVKLWAFYSQTFNEEKFIILYEHFDNMINIEIFWICSVKLFYIIRH